MKKNIQKIIMGAILFSLIFTSLTIPRPAQAFPVEVWASVDLVPLTTIAANTGVTAGATVATKIFDWGKFAKELAGSLLKKLILDTLVDGLINWINNGGKGAVVEDWDAFFRNAGQFAVGEVAKELGAGFLCSPFSLQLQIALTPPKKFSQQLNCSLDQITGNIDSFLKDFKNGGWIAYQEQWYPQNNFYGGFLIAWDEADSRAAAAKEAAKGESLAGGGFLSFKKCDADGKNCVITAPGSLGAEVAKAAYINIPANYVINASELSQYITAIADAAINKLVKVGINGLKRTKKSSTYTNVTNSNPCAGLTGETYSACIGYQKVSVSNLTVNRNSMIKEINSVLEPRQEAASILNQLINQQSQLVAALKTLTSCQPSNASAAQDFQTESATLTELKDKYEANQTFVEPLQSTAEKINLGDWQSAVIEFNNVQQLLDSDLANVFLNAVKNDQTIVTDNVNTKLPIIQNQSQGCPIIL